MKKQDYKFKSTREQLELALRMDAQLVQAMAKTVCVTSDMEIEIDRMRKDHEEWKKLIEDGSCTPGFKYTDYIAIRGRGVEGGSQQAVKERCKILGQPVVVYKIDMESGSEEVEVTKRIVIEQ